jgi:hypothetical protein
MEKLLATIKFAWLFEADSSNRFFFNSFLSRRRRTPQFINDGSSDEPNAAPLAQLDLAKLKDSKLIEHSSSDLRIEKGR